MADALCSVCGTKKLASADEVTNSICAACAAKVRPRATTADPRPRVPCRGCNHTQLLRTILVDETDVSYREAGVPVGDPRVDRAVWSGEIKAIVPTLGERATLIAYVCRGCGLTELYTDGFAELRVGPQYSTELIDVSGGSAGPFR